MPKWLATYGFLQKGHIIFFLKRQYCFRKIINLILINWWISINTWCATFLLAFVKYVWRMWAQLKEDDWRAFLSSNRTFVSKAVGNLRPGLETHFLSQCYGRISVMAAQLEAVFSIKIKDQILYCPEHFKINLFRMVPVVCILFLGE